jgi:hypothetical protein
MSAPLLLMRSCLFAAVACFVLTPFSPASAIITKQAPGRNLSAPTGDFAGRGWEFTGRWGGFLGTPIAPHYFVTAKHLGGAIGQKLFYRGKAYTAVESFPCPDNDLTVWRVAEPFPAWAPLYSKNQEMDKPVFVTGCGTARGAPVRTRDGKLRGWRWGADDHQQSWGVNQISGVANYTTPDAKWKNEMLSFSFSEDGSPNEGIVSGSDSGGAVFIQDTDGIWKLAGVIYGVDSTLFSTTESGKDAAPAALFDARGLYEKVRQTGEMHYHDPLRPDPEPTTAGATRISSSLPFLRSVVPDLRPFPLGQVIVGISAAGLVMVCLLLIRHGTKFRRARRRRFQI